MLPNRGPPTIKKPNLTNKINDLGTYGVRYRRPIILA